MRIAVAVVCICHRMHFSITCFIFTGLLLRLLALLRTLRIRRTQFIRLRLHALDALGTFLLPGFRRPRLHLDRLYFSRVGNRTVGECNLTLIID